MADVEVRGFLLRPNWFAIGGGTLLAVAGLAAAELDSRPSGAFGYLALILGTTCACLVVARKGFPRSTPCVLRASKSGLALDGAPEVPLHDVLEAKRLVRRDRASVVDLTLTRRRRLSLLLTTRDAKALLEIIGARRTRFALVATFGKRFVLALGLLAPLFLALVMAQWRLRSVTSNLASVPVPLLSLSTFTAWLLGFVRGGLVVGADGFTTRWLFRERFVPFRDVASVKGVTRIASPLVDTRVMLRSGRKVRLRAVEAPRSHEDIGAEGRSLLDCVSAAYAASTGDRRVDVAAALRRDELSPREWLERIDAALHGGYRTAAVPMEALDALAADPTGSRDARVGAATALVRVGDPGARMRVRVAAEACADSELRDVLRAVADSDDDQSAEQALRALGA